MLIFDDDEDFAMAIREQPWVKRTFDAHIEQDWRNIDNNFRLNDSWDIILTDVAVPNTTGWGGHEMIKNTVDQRRLNTPIIVMSGDADVELKKLERKHGTFFDAYISKSDMENFFRRLRVEVEKAVSKKDPFPRLHSLFEELGKLDEVITNDPEPRSLSELGVLNLAEKTTVEMLIQEGKRMDEPKILVDYMWNLIEGFRKKERHG
jgi:FixJ family two-component response regulator